MTRLAAVFAVFAIVTMVAAATAVAQQPAPFAAGDPKAGKALVDRDCVGCHAAKFAGDPDRMYTRADHRVTTPAKLLAQVQACNTNLAKGYFPEEEEHIAAYLNLQFYKFAP
jgi:cytochrome c553